MNIERTQSMFNNPVGIAAATKINSTHSINLYGEYIWDRMCASYERFTTREIADQLVEKYGLAPRTARNYVVCFFAYCRACPNEFSGPATKLVKNCGSNSWKLEDNPES